MPGEPVRLVQCTHEACGASTRVRVPRALPARAVRRVVCEECRQPFECEAAADGGVVAAEAGGRSWSQGRAWKYLSIPLAAAAVIVALILIQGSGGSDQPSSTTAAPNDVNTAKPEPRAAPPPAQGAQLVKGSSYTLALPDGWKRTAPPNGATFAAAAQGGGAEATLWVTSDPSLSFSQFESQSMDQLRQLAGSAKVVDRTAAPTVDGTIVTLAANSPPGQPVYQVTLRATGPYRYYLATTVEPNASQTATQGAELIRSSFVPVATGKSG
jgi:hypothetical protein